jgi:hypothetical protein
MDRVSLLLLMADFRSFLPAIRNIRVETEDISPIHPGNENA